VLLSGLADLIGRSLKQCEQLVHRFPLQQAAGVCLLLDAAGGGAQAVCCSVLCIKDIAGHKR
jgi:hypothetical protein